MVLLLDVQPKFVLFAQYSRTDRPSCQHRTRCPGAQARRHSGHRARHSYPGPRVKVSAACHLGALLRPIQSIANHFSWTFRSRCLAGRPASGDVTPHEQSVEPSVRTDEQAPVPTARHPWSRSLSVESNMLVLLHGLLFSSEVAKNDRSTYLLLLQVGSASVMIL